MEKPYNSPPSFYHWFVKHCKDVVARHMICDVRERAGLGSPPEPYYTNAVESKNKLLKEEVQYKSSQLPDFVEKMKRMMLDQRQEVERAVANSGEYRLAPGIQKFAVDQSKWFLMTHEQRRRRLDRFMKSPLQCCITKAMSTMHH